jgi:GNAT superfamily N-acetyltransferase
MELTWLDPANREGRDLAGAVAVLEAARAVDKPHMVIITTSLLADRLRYGWDGQPPLGAVVHDARGRVVGYVEVWLGQWDNTHAAVVKPTVDPLVRRQGIGRWLFEAGVQRCRADGRTLVVSDSMDQPAAVAFAAAMGMARASASVQRRQDLSTVDWARLDKEYAAAEGKAAGYELLRIAGRTPEHQLADVVAMTAAINDAPVDDLEVEDEVFSPERVRGFENSQIASGKRMYRVVARERETGIFAGHTMVGVVADRPWFAWQYDTSVLRAHRGHRLGLLVKIDMLRWLAEQEPQVRTIDTSNAASNTHMIQVNELLGYQVVGTVIEWQRRI